jgi:hypothetical protein
MSWFRENRFLGAFLILVSACTVVAVWFLFSAKSDWDDAASRFDLTAAELTRLERLAPYPSDNNLRKMKADEEDYATALERLKGELKTQAFPLAPMAPNEFQSRLRLVVAAVVDKARANNVKLPDKFYLGFDEFASALPSEVAASLLGQELAQIEWLLNTLFEARVDALTSFHRIPLAEDHGTVPGASTSTPAGRRPGVTASPRLLERNIVETTFVSTPAAARKVLNQIAAANEQFFVVRLLHVRNEKDKGPPREVVADTSGVVAASLPAPAGSPGTRSATPGSLSFIVGNERVETSMRIEIVRFAF